MAGWVGGAASVAMLLSVGESMAKLHTVDLRQSVAGFLDSQRTTLNLDVDQALMLARIGLLVTGAASAATLVFAVFATRRDRSARVAMSVLAVPLLVCGVFVDPFLAGFIVAAAVLLWTRPAADWFAGRAPREQPATGPSGSPDHDAGRPDPFQPPSQGSVTQPAAPAPPSFGASYGEPVSASHAPEAPPAQPGPQPGIVRRPRQVTTACVISWAASGLVALMMVGTVLALQSGQVVHDMHSRLGDNPALVQSGMSFHDVLVTVRVAAVLVLLWALAAIVVAVFAYRRQNWARITLTVSAGVSAALGLVSSISFLGFLLVTAAAVAATVLLLHRDSSRWYAGARGQRPSQSSRPQPPTRPW